MPSDSVIIVAIGVVRESGTSEPLVSIAPSITSPVIISWYGSPEDFETSWESPSVPPAPSTLKTSMPSSSLESRDAAWNARAVVSQPPPAAAGAMIESWRVGYGCEASSPPEAPPGATIATTAATASTPPMRTRDLSIPNPRTPEPPRNYPCPPCSGPSPSSRRASRCCSQRAATAATDDPPPQPASATEVEREASDLDATAARPTTWDGAKDATFEAPGEQLDPAKTYVATVTTNCGDFEITLDAKRAPKTGGSFKFLADQRFYDGVLIHRVVPKFVLPGRRPAGHRQRRPRLLGGRGAARATSSTRRASSRWPRAAPTKPGSSGSQFFVVTGEDARELEARVRAARPDHRR